jgi:hypothetical protein
MRFPLLCVFKYAGRLTVLASISTEPTYLDLLSSLQTNQESTDHETLETFNALAYEVLGAKIDQVVAVAVWLRKGPQ